MNIKHFKHPFYHTIIYDFFDDDELLKINAELNDLFKIKYDKNDVCRISINQRIVIN